MSVAGLALWTSSLGLCQTGSWLNVRECGAIGRGVDVETVTLQHVIDSAAAGGGGTVFFPAGIYRSGTLQLRSNVCLHLSPGAVLKGSTRLQDYVLGGRRVGLLFTQDAENISIVGGGTIDGDGDVFMDLAHPKHMAGEGVKYTRQGERFREVKEGLGDGPVVPLDRPYQMVIFSDCRHITLRDVRIRNSPFWTVHFADCDGVVLSGVIITGNLLVPNNDGVDFTSCRNVRVSDCDIETGDDAIVVTGYDHHYDLPGFKGLKHPCENIAVTNCTLVSRSSAIRIGGFDQNPMRNMAFSNLIITNSNRGIGIFARDVGSIENLVFENVVIQTRLHTGDWWGNGEPVHLSAVRLTKDVHLGKIKNVKFHNLVCHGEAGIVVYGTDENVLEDVSFDNLSLEVTGGPLEESSGGNFDLRPVLDPALSLFAHDIPAFYARHVKNLRLRDVDIRWKDVESTFFTRALVVEDFNGLCLEGFHGDAAPPAGKTAPVLLSKGKRVVLNVQGVKVEQRP